MNAQPFSLTGLKPGPSRCAAPLRHRVDIFDRLAETSKHQAALSRCASATAGGAVSFGRSGKTEWREFCCGWQRCQNKHSCSEWNLIKTKAKHISKNPFKALSLRVYTGKHGVESFEHSCAVRLTLTLFSSNNGCEKQQCAVRGFVDRCSQWSRRQVSTDFTCLLTSCLSFKYRCLFVTRITCWDQAASWTEIINCNFWWPKQQKSVSWITCAV